MAELTGATEVLCQLAGSQHTDQDECSLVCKGRDSGIAYRVVVDGGEADRVRVASTLSRHFDTVDEALNAWNPASALSALNAAPPGEWVAAPDALLSVCREVDWLHGHTAGLFDPTVASVARACGIGPPAVAAEATAPPVGWRECVEVSYATRRVRRTRGGVAVDLCGVAKGWWVDRVVEALQDLGYSEIYVEWGGDVRCVGAWEVAVVRPGEAAGAGAAGFAGRVAVANACVATSGDYVKTKKAEGGGAGLVNENSIHPFKRVPMPVCAGGGGGIASVTVASTSCARADGLATAFMLAEQMPQLLSSLLAPSSPLLGVLDARTGGVIVQTRGGGGSGGGAVDPLPQAWSDNGGAGVFSTGCLRSVLPPSATTATATGEAPSANLERLAIHKHCRDLVKTTPKQLYWLSIEGGFAASESPPASPSSAAAGAVGIVVSSLVVLPGGGRYFFALMKPSLMQREVEARLRRAEGSGGGPALRLSVYPLRTPPPLPLPLGYDPIACGAVDARACARVCVERTEDIGDHLAVVACDEDRAGAAVEVPVASSLSSPPAADVVVRQHGTAFAVRPAPLPSGGVKARAPGLGASGSPFVDSPCVVYNTSRLSSGDALRGERRVARGLRLFSMVPYVVCFVLEGGRHDAGGWVGDGDTLRLHVLDSHQHALVDLAARRESEVQKIKLRAMDGFILPSELGFIDCRVTAVSPEGVVFATPSVSVALSRPPEAALLVSYAPRADAVGVQIPHPDSEAPVWPLVAAVLTRLGLSAVVAVIFYLWCVAPFMIQP